jgi:hypothetical protein
MYAMGLSYAHVVLFGPRQRQVADRLADRQAAVSPTVNGFTLVADEEFKSHARAPMYALGVYLASELACPAVVVSEFDDDVLCYQLIEAAELSDEYNSEPDYFDFAVKHAPPRGPQGGNADRLCAALKRPGAREQVDRILHRQDFKLRAPDRHRELAAALGMPGFCVGFDYCALQNGELPEGLNDFDVIFTASKADG